ncbi:MAG TPA: ABC transporter ATP-binding protein [Streptosporangiaceae bacterium]|nr:ABC transporter ATP-binding protein [Streptosporangiaceae bacterium]
MREYLRPYYLTLALMITAAIVAVTAETMIPLITKSVIDGAIAHGSRGRLLPLGLAAIALGTLQAGLNFYRRWSLAGAVNGMEKTIRDDLYHHLQQLDPGFHDSWQSGQLLSRATNDLSTIRRFAGFGVVFFITSTWTFLLIVALLIHMNWWLGLLTGLLFAPVGVLCLRFEKKYRVLSRMYQDQTGDLATYVEEAAAGIRVLKSLGRRNEAAARHLAQSRLVYRSQVGKARLRGTFWAGLDMAPNAAIGMLLLLGALAVSWHQLTLGGLVAFVTLTLLLIWPIEAMGFIIATGQEAATAAQRIYEIFDTDPEITDPYQAFDAQPGVKAATPAPLPLSTATATAAAPPSTGTAGHLVFDRVRFRYPGAPAETLRGVTLDIAPGETIALVGSTGSGKSTLLQLVPRLADATSGLITLAGTDIRDLPLAELRTRVGCAFEDPTLFSASVRENVSFGVQDASEEDVLAALAAAQADFVVDLPWGLDTRIGEQGMALSGGQRQRVALARAILARPEVLLLDDPLSALDVHTEAKVTAALADVMATSTALVVAHRPSTVLLADRVALLADGVIAALGTHHELLASEPRYRDLMSGTDLDGSDGPGVRAGARR